MRQTAATVLRSALLISLAFQSGLRFAQAEGERWTSIGPFTGQVWDVAVDPSNPDTAYAATDGAGIFKTTDRGASWATANQGLAVHNIIESYALTIDRADPTIIFAGTGDGVFRSTNGGINWTHVKQTRTLVFSLAIDQSNSR